MLPVIDDRRKKLLEQVTTLPEITPSVNLVDTPVQSRPELPPITTDATPPDSPEYQIYENNKQYEVPSTTPTAIPVPDSPEHDIYENNKQYSVQRPDGLPNIGETYDRDATLNSLEKRLADTYQYKDKHWSKWDKVAAALQGWASGGIFGAVNAVKDPHFFERQRQERDRADILPKIAVLQHQRESDTAEKYKRTQIQNIYDDNQRQGQAAKDLAEWRTSETARKIGADEARERTARMRTVAGMLKDLPEFVPGDPKYKEIEKALGDVNLPITEKDAKKKVNVEQDQRTGAWSVILTNPVTGQTESRPVPDKDGKQYASTPTVVMQGELGLLKQNDQQAYQANENQKTRDFQAETKAAELQFRAGLKQFDVANGRQKTLDNATNAFKQQFYRINKRNPSQEEIDTYLANVVVPALQ